MELSVKGGGKEWVISDTAKGFDYEPLTDVGYFHQTGAYGNDRLSNVNQ